MRQHFLCLCFLVSPFRSSCSTQLTGKERGLVKSKFLDGFLLPVFVFPPAHRVGKLEEKGEGRVTKYCSNYDRWNERLGNSENSAPPDSGDDPWLMKWQDPATMNVRYRSSQTGNHADNRY